MIKYNPSLKEIELALNSIRRLKQEPIIYCSQESALRVLSPIVGICVDKGTLPIIVKKANPGICGTYYGTPVYITDEAEDAFIIVPQYKEETK